MNSNYPLNPNPNFPNPQFSYPPPPPPPPPPQSQNLIHHFPNSLIHLNPNPNFPNSNPNPSFTNPQFYSAPPPPPPPQLTPPPNQTESENPVPDLPSALSSLKTLIETCNSTLNSLSTLLPSLSLSPSSNSLIQCPFNHHHRVPASSLFRHYLNCPSPLDIGPVIETLQYRKTLKSDHNLVKDNNFVQTLDDGDDSELCFTVDDYVDLDGNFFYKDCPGIVNLSSEDGSKRMFTLPRILSVECANFVGCGDKSSDEFDGSRVKFLSSEIWFVRCNVEHWSDFPNEYSLSVCKAVLRLECGKQRDLSMWVIENSPRFGIVIDVAMRDHLCVLFRLCLKALVKEADCSYKSFNNRIDDESESRNYNPRALTYKCPALVEVLRWLTSQLTILYGELNSRSLVIAMLRHFLYKGASDASLFPLEMKLDESSGKASDNDCSSEMILEKPIFVYQIAAAIAALHERASLEERIRALRNPPRLAPYQRVAEYLNFTKKAEEERQKRPDYKPLIEHDGLLNQSRHDQGGNRAKTKEELLAEERDYKRQRMSYRGKKLKRSAKEVMRDIIEEYMEAIKDTGGIGGPEKEDSEKSMLISANSFAVHATSSKLNNDSRTDMQDDSRTPLDNDYNYHDTKSIHPSRRVDQHKKESYNHKHYDDRGRTSRNTSDKDCNSRSPSRDRRHSRSTERRSHISRNQVNENDRSRSNYNYSSRRSGRKDKRKLDSPDRHKRKTHKCDRSDSFERVETNDRYDPSETSPDTSDYTRSRF